MMVQGAGRPAPLQHDAEAQRQRVQPSAHGADNITTTAPCQPRGGGRDPLPTHLRPQHGAEPVCDARGVGRAIDSDRGAGAVSGLGAHDAAADD